MADQDEVLDIEADDTQLDDVEAVADPASEPEVVAGSVVETAEATEATEATEPIDPVAEFKATLRNLTVLMLPGFDADLPALYSAANARECACGIAPPTMTAAPVTQARPS